MLFNERDTVPRSKRGLVRPPLPEHIALRLAGLHNGGEMDTGHIGRVEWRGDIARLPTAPEAEDMLDAALDWFEDQAIIQKGVSGLESLFLGAYELVGKVSLILAVPEGLRSAEHVRWAFALIKRDLEAKMRLVTANDREVDAPALALRMRVEQMISGDEGETLNTIATRLKKVRKEDIENCLRRMVDGGDAEAIESIHKYNKRKIVRYKLVERD